MFLKRSASARPTLILNKKKDLSSRLSTVNDLLKKEE